MQPDGLRGVEMVLCDCGMLPSSGHYGREQMQVVLGAKVL